MSSVLQLDNSDNNDDNMREKSALITTEAPAVVSSVPQSETRADVRGTESIATVVAEGSSGSENNCVERVENVESAGQQQTFIVYKRRWIILAIFMFLSILNQIHATAFVTVVAETKTYYRVNSLEVNALPSIYAAMFIVLAFPSYVFYERAGFRTGMILSTAMCALGALCKFISVYSPHYVWLVLAMIFAGFAQVLQRSLPPMLASQWFPLSQRTLATSLGTQASFIGFAISFFYTPRVIDRTGDKTHFFELWISQLVPSALSLVLAVLFVKDSPPTPPSITADKVMRVSPTGANNRDDNLNLNGGTSHRSSTEPSSQAERPLSAETADNKDSGRKNPKVVTLRAIMTNIKICLSNYNYIVLVTGFSVAAGIVSPFGNVVTQVLGPYGITPSQIGQFASIGMILGIISSLLICSLVDKIRRYKIPIIVLYVIETISNAVYVILLIINRKSPSALSTTSLLTAAYFCLTLTSICGLPTYPIALEFAVEITYPTPSLFASTFVLIIWSLTAVIMNVVYSAMITDKATKETGLRAFYLLIAGLVCGIIILFFVKEERRRLDKEKKNEEKAKKEEEEERKLKAKENVDDKKRQEVFATVVPMKEAE